MSGYCRHPSCMSTEPKSKFFGYCIHCWAKRVSDVEKNQLRTANSDALPGFSQCPRCLSIRAKNYCAQCGGTTTTTLMPTVAPPVKRGWWARVIGGAT